MSGGTTRREFLRLLGCGAAALGAGPLVARRSSAAGRPPNVVLCMTDDQGWGDTGYNGHPALRTPALDEMAASGVRFDRFYSAAPVCSPTRGSVLTGRHPNRFGCFLYGYPIRVEEVTIARAAKAAGYVTGHFGKWHLNGRRGPGVPVLADDPLNPGRLGFDEWLSASNYFDLDPSFGRNGRPESFKGDGSDIIVEEALKFIARAVREGRPFLAVVWYGSPHRPHRALAEDAARFGGDSYLGEIAAVDRSVGRLRRELRALGVADETLLWFCSDNGGNEGPRSTGGLRGAKGTCWEGGIRVPGIVEWPARVARPFATAVPCSTSDIYPTFLDIAGVTMPGQPQPLDGTSILPVIEGRAPRAQGRPGPIFFWHAANEETARALGGHAAAMDSRMKLHRNAGKPAKGGKRAAGAVAPGAATYELYDIAADGNETTDLASKEPERASALRASLEAWQQSVLRSLSGADYGAARAGGA